MMSHPNSCNLYPSSRFFLGNTKVLRACCQPAEAKMEMQLPNGVKSFWAYCFFKNFGSYQVIHFFCEIFQKRLHLGMAPAILENLRNSSASRIDPPNPSSPCSSNAVITSNKEEQTSTNHTHKHGARVLKCVHTSVSQYFYKPATLSSP